MMAELAGRIALVTGASQGIGRACALELAKAGATVALAARNEAKLAEVASEIEAAGGQAAVFGLDVASEESIKNGAKAVLDRFGRVEILVNNAGITRDDLMMRMKRADWDEVLRTNLTGTFLLTQAAAADDEEPLGTDYQHHQRGGRTGQGGQVNYAASKAGLIGFTRSLAREVASRGITVNAVAPGYIETPMTAVLDEKLRAKMVEQIPLGRPGNRYGDRAFSRLSRIGESRIYYGACAGCEWRDVYGVEEGNRGQELGTRVSFGAGAHDGDGGGDEGVVLKGTFYADRVAGMDVGEGDGVAAFSEGGVFVGGEGAGGVVGPALDSDLHH